MSHSINPSTKFLFDTDFDCTVIEPVYDQQDIEIACRQRYIEGIDAGRLQALKEIEGILSHIARSLSDLGEIRKQSFITTGIIAEKITHTMFPAFFDKGACVEVKAVVNDVLDKLNCDNQLTLYCAELMVPTLKDHINTLHTDIPIVVKEGEGMHMSDIKIDWKTGFAERDQAKLQETLDGLLANYKETTEGDKE